MIKAAFFPTLIYAKDLKLDINLFEREIIAWSQKDPGVQKTNVKGWHSKTNMHTIPVFKPLVDELYKMQGEIYKELPRWCDNMSFIREVQPHFGNGAYQISFYKNRRV